MEPFNYPPSPHTAAKIRELLALLRGHPLAPLVKVFGSAVHKKRPKDLDIFIDLPKAPWAISLNQILRWSSAGFEPSLRTSGVGSAMQGRYFGLLDVFVLFDNNLYVRDEHGVSWVLARHAVKIKKAGLGGVSLVGKTFPIENSHNPSKI